MEILNSEHGFEHFEIIRKKIIESHGEGCFLCGEKLFDDDKDGFVWWAGQTYIGLHSPCAIRLGVAFIRDAQKLLDKTGKTIRIEDI